MTLLTNLTARMSTADPAPAQVSFVAIDVCGHPVTWRQVYGHDPVPDACEKAPCLAGSSDRIEGATPHSEAPNGLASAGASNQPTRLNERTS